MTNRVMRSCKCNGVADLLKQAPLPYVLSYMVTMGLYRTVSEINCENRKFFFPPPPVYLTPPLKGYPSELGIGAWDQIARTMILPTDRKEF